MTQPETRVTQLDLSACAREPIHIPGAIQPHGFLFAFDPIDLTIRQVSANTQSLLNRAPASLVNGSMNDWLPGPHASALRRALGSPSRVDPASLALQIEGHAMHGSMHRSSDLAILELEPDDGSHSGAPQLTVDDALKRLAAAIDLPRLLDATTQAVAELTGFDRVLVYRFDEDDHGEVIREVRAPDMEPYLGLHYPESDIPRQARELYRRNWIRYIPDARYEPVPLLPESTPGAGKPLDLSLAMLRSVSPVHLEYLANMGLRASMSVSLIVGDRLWGLISCGHREPRTVHHRVRGICETIGRMVSLQIGALQSLELQRRESEKRQPMQRLAARMHSEEAEALDGLCAEPEILVGIADAAGAAVILEERVSRFGACPSEDELRNLSHWIYERASADGLFRTRQLAVDDPRWSALAHQASGVLAFLLPPPLHRCVLWFRPELEQTVNWGGNPHKRVEVDIADGTARLHPRRSFELWKEVVRGRSLPWGETELNTIAELRRYAIEADLVRQVERERAAVLARDELVAVVSHDLRNPMSVVIMQAALIQRLLADDPGEASQRLRVHARTIQRAGERMKTLLQDLLDLARIEAGRFKVRPTRQNAGLMLQDATQLLQTLAEAKNVRLLCEQAPDLSIRADPERVFQVFSNLIGNAVKFAPEGSIVRLGARRVQSMCEFWTADQGPGIDPPELPHIFDRYWQARRSDGAGAGLGLYISRGIVEAHGGTIRAESMPGHGATFIFTLPLDF